MLCKDLCRDPPIPRPHGPSPAAPSHLAAPNFRRPAPHRATKARMKAGELLLLSIYTTSSLSSTTRLRDETQDFVNRDKLTRHSLIIVDVPPVGYGRETVEGCRRTGTRSCSGRLRRGCLRAATVYPSNFSRQPNTVRGATHVHHRHTPVGLTPPPVLLRVGGGRAGFSDRGGLWVRSGPRTQNYTPTRGQSNPHGATAAPRRQAGGVARTKTPIQIKPYRDSPTCLGWRREHLLPLPLPPGGEPCGESVASAGNRFSRRDIPMSGPTAVNVARLGNPAPESSNE
jgi:hypothetical protein